MLTWTQQSQRKNTIWKTSFQLSPAQKIPSPSKEIALIIVLQVFQRFLSQRQNQEQSRPWSGQGTFPDPSQPQTQQSGSGQPIFRVPGQQVNNPASASAPLTGTLGLLGLGGDKYVTAGISMVQNLVGGNTQQTFQPQQPQQPPPPFPPSSPQIPPSQPTAYSREAGGIRRTPKVLDLKIFREVNGRL